MQVNDLLAAYCTDCGLQIEIAESE